MIQARYRRDYIGEFVIAETRLIDGVKQETREWIDNPIKNLHTSGRAAVIGSRIDQRRFQHQRLARHRGGLLGSRRLQTYASGDIWEDMRLDFYVTIKREILSLIMQRGYDRDTIVFSNSSGVMAYPGHFYPVPYTPYLSDVATAVYLASFDGHEEVFLIGFNADVGWEDRRVISDVSDIISAYTGTKYISIGAPAGQPEQWLALPNFSTMPVKDFVSYCDI